MGKLRPEAEEHARVTQVSEMAEMANTEGATKINSQVEMRNWPKVTEGGGARSQVS